MTDTNLVPCHFCGALLNAGNPKHYKMVTGWARMRRRGTNEVALRHDLNQFAHADCVDQQKLTTRQAESLF